MIVCENVNKQYGKQVVLSDFSCRFENTGFYLLYGESGSGKTTLINILSGLIPFDGEKITVNDSEFNSIVNLSEAGFDFDYITQDSFFADFLTVSENLSLISDDKDKIDEVLLQFGLSGAADQSPSTLSGGERQRLSIARACLSKKRILFLDEPTASLDEANKIAIFELLNKLKKDTLIICSSHDSIAKNYADEIITFQKCTETKDFIRNASSDIVKHDSIQRSKEKKTSVGKYLLKWFASKKRNRRAELKFCVFLTLAIMLILLGDLPSHKQDMNYEYSYRVNALTLKVHSKEATDYDTLCNMEKVKRVVLSYAGSTPDGINHDNVDPDATLPLPEHELSLYTLPFESEYFNLTDRIVYGGYFTDENQVILSYEEAEKLSPGNHKALIGSTITKNIYSLGNVRFEVVGVLGELNTFEQKYFLSLGMNYNSIYFNSKLTDRFIQSHDYYMENQRTYYLYFDSYRDLSDFYNEYFEKFENDYEHLSISSRLNAGRDNDTIHMLGTVLVPLSIFIAIFTVLFYSTLLKTEITYNHRFIAVFEYSGYSKKKVISSFVAIHILRLLLMSVISFAIAYLITEAVNIVNRKIVFIGFQLFTLNLPLMLIFLLFVVLLSFACISVSLHRVKIASWYDNLIRQRDLL